MYEFLYFLPYLCQIYYEKYVTDKARYDREMEDYQRSKQNQGGGGGQPSTPAATASLPHVEPLALTSAVQQTVPLLLQAGEEVVPEP